MKDKSFIPIAQPDLTGNEKNYLIGCFNSGWISSKGEYIERFEKEFAKFIGSKFAVATSNGTVALHLALVALGITKGDEVIVPDLTFVASANSVTYCQAIPVLVDVDRKTWNLDTSQVEKKITKKTKAIMAVHLYGNPADLVGFTKLSQKYNLFLIEDAAEAHGAEVKITPACTGRQSFNKPINTNKKIRVKDTSDGVRMHSSLPRRQAGDGGGFWRKVGSVGDVGCFSFYGNKIITTGEGGMVVTNNKDLADKMRILRDHGQKPDRRYYHEVIGFNYRMTNMQAAVGCAQLERITEFINKKRKIAHAFNQYFRTIPGITIPPEEKWAKNVYWMYSVLIDKPFRKSRDEMMVELEKNNIETRPFFHPLHTMPPYYLKEKFPNSVYLSLHGMNLPSSVKLGDKQIERIVQVFKKNNR